VGHYVHIHVAMAVDKNEPVAEIAKRHVDGCGDCREAKWFLEDLATRSGHNPGPKGGLSLWGMVGNYTDGEAFVKALEPFWLELFGTEAGPFRFEHILVFEEREQTERTTAYEISYDENTKQLGVAKHKCPFAFMQM
jgi:hypothetical protein